MPGMVEAGTGLSGTPVHPVANPFESSNLGNSHVCTGMGSGVTGTELHGEAARLGLSAVGWEIPFNFILIN